MSGLFPNFEDVEEWNTFTHHGFNEFETEEEAAKSIVGDRLKMLAETLREAGYQTVGFNTNPHLVGPRNFNQGFSEYEDFPGYMSHAKKHRKHRLEAAYPPADVVIPKVMSKIETLGENPFFLWVHLMEPHSPYLPPPPYDRISPRTFTDVPDLQVNDALYHELHRQWGAKPEKIVHPSSEEIGLEKDELIEHLLGLYEGEIRFCDAELGRMLTELGKRGLLSNTLVVITADHGEEFLDHGYVTHHVYSALAEELIRIPLVIHFPGGIRGGGRVDDLVRMVDIAPTILDYVGLIELADSMEGSSLRSLIESDSDDPRMAFFSTIQYEIVRTEQWKYRLEKNNVVNGRPVERLFDIVADPMETEDLAGKHPDVLIALRGEYAAFAAGLHRRGELVAQGASAREPTDAIDEETKERLEALGYLD
jgi:arylsulfatase A-like enzyme